MKSRDEKKKDEQGYHYNLSTQGTNFFYKDKSGIEYGTQGINIPLVQAGPVKIGTAGTRIDIFDFKM